MHKSCTTRHPLPFAALISVRLTLAASGMSMVIELRGMNEYGHMIDGRPVPAH